MRVVHVVDRMSVTGGVQTYLRMLLPALAARGVEGVLVTAEPAAVTVAGAEVVGVPGLDSDAARLDAGTRRRLRAALASARPDAVCVHVVPSPAVAVEAAASARTLVHVHDYLAVCPGNARYLHASRAFCAEGPGTRCFVRAYSERCTNRRPDRVARAYRRARAWQSELPALEAAIVASPFMARVLESAGAPPGHVRVVPYPVEIPAPVTARPPGGADVLFVGRLVAAKGAHVLLRALARLPGVTAAVAGDGPERPALEALASELGIDDRVRFRGWVTSDERRELFAASRVLALPSLWQEPFGIVGLEALAAGLPVVASEVGGIPSWLDDGAGGLLVPPADPDRMSAAIARVLGDDMLCADLRSRGLEVAARFTIDRHLELLLPELEAVAS